MPNLAYLGSDERWWPNLEREASARDGAAARGIPNRRVGVAQPTFEDARDLLSKMEHRPGELIVAFDDIVAHCALAGLAERGLQAPTDYRLLGCDDALPINTTPRLSTVHLDTRLAARQALELLLSQESWTDPPRILVDGRYRPGDTS